MALDWQSGAKTPDYLKKRPALAVFKDLLQIGLPTHRFFSGFGVSFRLIQKLLIVVILRVIGRWHCLWKLRVREEQCSRFPVMVLAQFD
jgi:hypothetical protein